MKYKLPYSLLINVICIYDNLNRQRTDNTRFQKAKQTKGGRHRKLILNNTKSTKKPGVNISVKTCICYVNQVMRHKKLKLQATRHMIIIKVFKDIHYIV